MKQIKAIAGIAIILAVFFTGCSNETKDNKEKESTTMEAEKGEHARDVGEKGEGEEEGVQLEMDDVYDDVRKGAHLVLSYDAETNSFVGTVENTSEEVIENVRVEVHLSNGIELGPTTPTDLQPAEKVNVKLEATEEGFETWSTHAEVGSSEHSHEGEGEHSHEGEGEGEHGEEGEGEGEHK